jgi:hypothetical protein
MTDRTIQPPINGTPQAQYEAPCLRQGMEGSFRLPSPQATALLPA